MRIISLLFFVFVISTGSLFAQEFKYAHYDVNNGLAGSIVYCILQDKQGFMWFGTETGVSRFDGTHFKNFGTGDGLPDNEIIDLFQDSKGRIWMAPFKKTVCYFYEGKIYNSDNDSLLRMIKPRNHVLGFAEDKHGNILIMESDQLHLVGEKTVQLLTSINGKPITVFLAISKSIDGGFLVLEKSGLYEFNNTGFHLLPSIKIPYLNFNYVTLNEYLVGTRTSFSKWTLRNLQTDSVWSVQYDVTSLNIQFLGDSLLFSNGHSGSTIQTLQGASVTKQFLANKTVSRTFVDYEGNYWFSTIGEGVFRLASENMVSVELRSKVGRKLEAYAISVTRGSWIIGANMMHLFEIKYDSSRAFKKSLIWEEWGSNFSSRTTAVERLNEKEYVLGSDMIIEIVPTTHKTFRGTNGAIKALFKESRDRLLVATRANVIRYSIPDFKVIDTIWNERATTVFSRKDTVYIGTLDGLYLALKDRSKLFAGKDEPLLRNRISAIKESPDGLLWIATNGDGVLGYRNGKVEKKIRVLEGLSSNNCRTIWINKNEIWIGTDKGLNRVVDGPGGYSILKITVGDGLSSNEINSVAVDSNMVVVATPEGVNFFDASRISFESHCSLVMDNIQVSDRSIDPGSRSFSLAHQDNNIKFQYAGISFRSGGEMNYNYRLIGLDTSWKTTSENFLEYPTLPSGEYALQLQAINKFGIKSEVINVSFTVEKLLTEKTWFRISVALILITIVSLFVAWLLRRVRRRETEKNEIRRKIAELEQMALKSQMNPHFIFNCLNSIQQFVLDKDVEGSNRFITGFSRLIRQTLDISARQEISLSEEITYLSTYLELEKTRFEEKFTFEVKVLDGINPDELYLPPMMLQPFVENSIRHGLRYRADKLGMILITFNEIGHELICLVEDNGIGRKEALRHKSRNPIEYQSKGMSLISSRVAFLNRDAASKITIKIEDLLGENENAIGTRVMLKFPLENGLNNTPP